LKEEGGDYKGRNTETLERGDQTLTDARAGEGKGRKRGCTGVRARSE